MVSHYETLECVLTTFFVENRINQGLPLFRYNGGTSTLFSKLQSVSLHFNFDTGPHLIACYITPNQAGGEGKYGHRKLK